MTRHQPRMIRRSDSADSAEPAKAAAVAGGSGVAAIEPVVWPPKSPSARLVEILREGLGDGESLIGPEGRWTVHGR